MKWNKTALTWLTDGLRAFVKAALIIDAIMLAFFSTWLVAKFLIRLSQWIDSRFLDAPWAG